LKFEIDACYVFDLTVQVIFLSFFVFQQKTAYEI